MEQLTLGKFIQDEMQRRQMTIRGFAEFVGVNHAVIGKFRYYGIRKVHNKKPIGEPSLSFVAKLAKATNVDLAVIVALVYPDLTVANARAGILQSRIANLSPEQLELFDTFLRGLAFDNLQGGGNSVIEIIKRPD